MNTLIALSGAGLVAMLAEIFRIRKGRYEISLLLMAAVFAWNALEWGSSQAYFNRMLVFDPFAASFSGLLVGLGLLWLFSSRGFFRNPSETSEHLALVFFALAGCVVLTGYGNLTMLFLGIEIVSIAGYVLAGSDKQSLRSGEAALKYFLLGAFATGFLLLGMALVYGATATFDLQGIREWLARQEGDLPVYFYAGIVLLIAGMAFKVSAVPFHFWAPDVYEGSPAPVTAFMATLIKTAAMAAFYRLFQQGFAPLYETWAPAVAGLAAVTILAGNLMAVAQKSFKRLLAYSSIAHAGYMLLALAALDRFSPGALLYYAGTYSLASLAVFKLVDSMRNDESVAALGGYGKLNPVNAGLLTLLILSMAGIPPLAGFFGKYYVFVAAFRAGLDWLVALAVLGSLIGVFYYLRIVIAL
jgi:NADH-quinone oxidoreductase subunit N